VSEASGHRGLWTEAKYPGDAVRILALYREYAPGRHELGDIRIQHYETFVKVGSFLPGVTECSPGDTPKTWPEVHNVYRGDNQADLADAEFDRYVQDAYADGWQNYDRNIHGGLRG
jgi:hypothetical protein